MLRTLALVYLALWISTAHAFYPWFPTWLCKDDHICASSNTKRTIGVRDAASRHAGESVTLPIVRRETADVEVREPAPVRAARAALRMARRYALHHTSRLSKKQSQNDYTVLSAVDPTTPDSVGIDQDGTDYSYFIPVAFGSTQKSLYMLLDTGAGTTWVMGSTCQSSACTMHTTYGLADSTTLKVTGQDFSISYGSGAVSGVLANDNIAVAGMTVELSFGLANVTSNDFTHFPFDGILGLSMSQGATDNFVNVVKNDSLLKSNIYGVYLTRSSTQPNDGEITFGATDSSKYTGSIGYTGVASQAGGDWAIPMDDMGYNSSSAGITGRIAYIDTGTSYIFGPGDDVAALHKLIPGATSSDGVTYTVPCGEGTVFDDVTVTFSGTAYSISPEDFLSTPSSSGNCTSNIYGHEVVTGAWLLGDTFLKNVYAVFDVDQTRIGFAPSSDSVPGLVTMGVSTSQTATATTSPTASGQSSTLTAATILASVTPSPISVPGLSGHETAITTGLAVASTTGSGAASASTTPKSPASHLESSKYALAISSLVALIAILA